MGRLWQTLILSQWQPVFAHIPVESMVYQHQQAYYQALQDSTEGSDSAPFIGFMLSMILDAMVSVQESQEMTDQVTDQVAGLISSMESDPMSSHELIACPCYCLKAMEDAFFAL